MKNFIEDTADQIMLNSMANVFMEKLDPVGQEDDDIDNDGKKNTKSDSYLRNRRKSVGAAIAADKAKKVKKEQVELSLRERVAELTEKKLYKSEKATTSDEKEVEIAEKSVKNKITINPDIQEGKKGLWDNIHAKRKRGEKPAKKGDKDYPKTLNVEETEDSLRDRRMERGGVDGNNRYNKAPGKPNTFGKKKRSSDGPSAMDVVKAKIRAKYGDKAIIDTKKKKEED